MTGSGAGNDRGDNMAARTREMFLELHPGSSVGVPLNEALSFGVNEFADLYQRHVYGSSRHEATEWGRDQVRKRAEAYKEASRAVE